MPALSVGRPVVRTWTDSFGRSRLQVILTVRNTDVRWVRFSAARSTYGILDGTRRVTGGVFTALPAVIAPGETAYLVDTLSVPVAGLPRSLSTETHVDARRQSFPPSTYRSRACGSRTESVAACGRRDVSLTVGQVVTRPVTAAAIVVDRDGRPLAALYDSMDVRRLDPGEARPFVTDYAPGAPPVDPGTIGEVIGVAFESNA